MHNLAEAVVGEVPAEGDFHAEYFRERSSQFGKSEGVRVAEVIRAPFVVHDFTGNINQRQAVQVRGQQFATAVYLVKALGGGWDEAGDAPLREAAERRAPGN